MDRYRVDYMDGDGEILTFEIETQAMIKTNSLLIFPDKDGEGDYLFLKKNVINYKRREKL